MYRLIIEFKEAQGKTDIGFVAQELQQVLQHVVSGEPDGDIEKEPMGIDYGRLTPVLVSAIQELQAENAALNKEIAEIRNSIGLP